MTFGLLPATLPPDPGLVHATDHRERAIATLISQLRDKPRLTTLVSILATPIQELEDAIWAVYTQTGLDTAAGVQLDVLGRVVLEERGGLNDSDFRSIIRIKLLVLLSRGTGPEMIRIVQRFLLTNNFTYNELYPGSIEITIYDAMSAARAVRLKALLRRAKAGGVRLNIVDAGGSGTRFHYGTEGSGFGYGVGAYGGII